MANEISMGHARALLSLEPAMQVAIAQEIIKKGLSVRQVETLVADMAQRKQKKGKEVKKVRKDADTLRLEEDLSDYLGATVKIQSNQKGKGKLIIEFSNLDQFDGIISHFGSFD